MKQVQTEDAQTALCAAATPCDVVEACERSRPLSARVAAFVRAVLWAAAAALAAKLLLSVLLG